MLPDLAGLLEVLGEDRLGFAGEGGGKRRPPASRAAPGRPRGAVGGAPHALEGSRRGSPRSGGSPRARRSPPAPGPPPPGRALRPRPLPAPRAPPPSPRRCRSPARRGWRGCGSPPPPVASRGSTRRLSALGKARLVQVADLAIAESDGFDHGLDHRVSSVPSRVARSGAGRCGNARPEIAEHAHEPHHRQADDIVIATFDALDEHRALPLDAVGPRLVERLSGGDVGGDLRRRRLPHRHPGVLPGEGAGAGRHVDEREPGGDEMLPSGEAGEHRHGFRGGRGFPEHLAGRRRPRSCRPRARSRPRPDARSRPPCAPRPPSPARAAAIRRPSSPPHPRAAR